MKPNQRIEMPRLARETQRHRRGVAPGEGCLRATFWLAAVLGVIPARADLATLNVAADTFINSASPNNNAGGHGWFDAGMDGVGGVRRGLLRFNLEGVPPGSIITSAVVKLTVGKVPLNGPVDSTFDLFRLTADWGEGTRIGNSGSAAGPGEATWNARMSGTADWTVPGASSDAAATASASVAVGSTANASYSWTGAGLINDVQMWLDNPAENHGWLLVSQAEGSSRSVRGFWSRENGTSAGTLEVGYTPTTTTNAPPVVMLTSPTNDATFVAGLPVTIEAMAIDTDGTVTNVEFFDGSTSLGNVVAEPFSITVTLYTGLHALTAVVTDNRGATATSDIVTNTGITVPIADPIAERIPKGDLRIELQTIADGLAAPLGMAVPDDGSGRMFVYDQNGQVWVVTAAGRQPTPLLDLRDRLVLLGAYDERGLLGVAVHPDFAGNPLIYTYTSEPNSSPADFPNGLDTANDHQSVIAEWRLSSIDSNVVDLSSRREILRIDQPQSNHNGGAMHFGPDGMLYIVLGDGGQANDAGDGHVPGGNAQDVNRVWGKLLRLDVNGNNSANSQYGIPSDNPFVGADGLDEIWAYGFRNPFSFGFERGSDELYLCDVGQNRVEEVDVISKGGNYGWNLKEGTFWFDGSGNVVTAPVRPAPSELIDPIAEYDHDDGLAVISGYVYHGAAIPDLEDRFVFGDWGSFTAPSGRLFYLDPGHVIREFRLGYEDRPLGLWLRGFGQGPDGELYVFCSRQLGPVGDTGRMMKIVPVPPAIGLTGIGSADGTNVMASWSGGGGVSALQMKTALTDATWVDRAVTVAGAATLPQDSPAGFFRVRDAAHLPPIPLTVYLTGAAQRPTNDSPATGFGILAIDGNTLRFNIAYRGLTAVATAAHIHGPTNTTGNAGVRISLVPYNGGAFGTNGTLSGTLVLTDAEKVMILSGQSYVNIHNTNYPGGEIRGQIAPVNFQAELRGANERPDPVSTTAHGLANLALVGNQLTFNVTYGGLSGTASASHIHGPASAAQSTGVLTNLAPYNGGAYGSNGSLSGTITLTPEQLGYLVDGLTYLNFHTASHSAGEIRGQIVPHVTGTPLTALLSGLAERPTPLTNTASGSGTFSLEGDILTFNLVYAGLSAPATAAHIHGPTNTTGSAGVWVNLAPLNGGAWGDSGTVSGSVQLTKEQRDAMLGGLTYVNFHTTNHPAGEMRGQIAPVLMFASLAGGNERPSAIATPGAGSGTFALVRDQLALAVTYGGLLSPAIASHIHGPASLFGSAGVLVNLLPYNGGAYGVSGTLSGTTPLALDRLLTVIDGQTYVNFHTTNNANGEIRGQIMR